MDNKEVDAIEENTPKPSRKELLEMLDATIQNIESLPPQALYSPITHSDFWAALILLSSILKSDDSP